MKSVPNQRLHKLKITMGIRMSLWQMWHLKQKNRVTISVMQEGSIIEQMRINK